MKWLKENSSWIFLVATIFIFVYIIVSRIDIRNYKGEIQTRNDSITTLVELYRSWEDSAGALAKMVEMDTIRVALYRDSLENARIRYINQKLRHEKQVADLTRIPTDELYIDYVLWIDTVSFE